MKQKAHGQVRRSQVVTTYGPGALIDLPHESAIVAGLDEWPPPHKLEEVDDPRLARKLRAITGVAVPRMVAPPPASSDPGATPVGIGAWRFPEWFVVQEAAPGDGPVRSRRLVHRKALDDHRRFEGRPVVAHPVRPRLPAGARRRCRLAPVRASARQRLPADPAALARRAGDHRRPGRPARALRVRSLAPPLGRQHARAHAARDMLGREAVAGARRQRGLQPAEPAAGAHRVERLVPAGGQRAVAARAGGRRWRRRCGSCGTTSRSSTDASHLAFIKKKPKVAAALAAFTDDEVLAAIHAVKGATPGTERSVKEIELEALLAAPEGYGDDVPVDQNFHARRLPDGVWRPVRAQRGHRVGHPAPPAARGAGPGRVHAVRGGDAGHPRRVRVRRRARRHRHGAGLVPGGGETGARGCSCGCAATPSTPGCSGLRCRSASTRSGGATPGGRCSGSTRGSSRAALTSCCTPSHTC